MKKQKHVKDERKLRSYQCEWTYGEDFQYDPTIPLHTFETVEEIHKTHPFNYNDCKRRSYDRSLTDKYGRFYSTVDGIRQCYKMKGNWKETSVNRDNRVEEGVCYTNNDNTFCANIGDTHPELMRDPENKKQTPGFDEKKAETIAMCNASVNGRCVWASKLNDCISRATFEQYMGDQIPVLPSTWPKSVTEGNFAEYLEAYYRKLLDQPPPRYASVKGEGDRCNAPPTASGSKKAERLSMPQSIVNMVMRGMASKDSTNRGLLAWHSTGSGKTLTATCVMEAFWDSGKEIVFASSVEALASNPPQEFMNLARRFFPRWRNDLKALSEAEQMEFMKREFERRGVRFMSFAQLAHYAQIARPIKTKNPADREAHANLLRNAVLIIDEVHNIFKPLPTQALEHTRLKEFLMDYSNKRTENLNLVILTATPGDTPKEIVNLLNLVRDRTAPAIEVPDFENSSSLKAFHKSIKGLITYFDVSSDDTKFPRVKHLDPYVIPMSMHQYGKYVEAFRDKVTAEHKDFDALIKQEKVNSYYKPARKYANMLYEMEKKITLEQFSAKLPRLLNVLKENEKQKHYVYSAFYENRGFGGQGIQAIAKLVEKELGYERLTVAEAVALNKRGELPATKAKRYILVTMSELKHGKLSSGDCLRQLLAIYNHPHNVNGEYVHAMLASQSFNEGIDLKAVRHIHIFDPLLTVNKEIQTVGRAARYCSHKDLARDRNEWTVLIHRYLADYPVDIKLVDTAKMKAECEGIKKTIREIEARMEEVKSAPDNEEAPKKKKGKAGADKKKKEKKLTELKAELTHAKKSLKNAEANLKAVEYMDPRAVEMIDMKLFKEVKERARNVLTIQKMMKEASIDCKLLNEFHNAHKSAEEKYSCKA